MVAAGTWSDGGITKLAEYKYLGLLPELKATQFLFPFSNSHP